LKEPYVHSHRSCFPLEIVNAIQVVGPCIYSQVPDRKEVWIESVLVVDDIDIYDDDVINVFVVVMGVVL
jgi:hypothetical protein